MKFVAILVAASAISVAAGESTWMFERHGLSASLQEPSMDASPLRLACGRPGHLEIDILAGSKREVTLVGQHNIALTLRGEETAPGRITSNVYFKSIAAEFLRDEGEVEVRGARAYRIHLKGARGVLQTLESSCSAVS